MWAIIGDIFPHLDAHSPHVSYVDVVEAVGPVTCTEGLPESSHMVYSVHVQVTVGEGCTGWLTGHGWELRHWWPSKPIDAQHASQRANMKGAEAPLLSGVDAPNLAAVEQHTAYACPMYCNFGVCNKLSILDSWGQLGKHCGSLSDCWSQCLGRGCPKWWRQNMWIHETSPGHSCWVWWWRLSNTLAHY